MNKGTAKSGWHGAISLSGLPIPVKLYNSSREARVAFKNVHKDCHTPINTKRWCATCNKEVATEDLNKGFKIGKDKLIEFTEGELATVTDESHTIRIETMVLRDEIAPDMMDSIYHVAPGDYAAQAYSILTKTMEKNGQVLIGRFTMRGKEHIAAIMYFSGGLMLSTLKWSDEMYSITPLLVDMVPVGEPEVAMFSTLLERMKGKFIHDAYHDGAREHVEKLIDMKQKGEVITITTTPEAKPVQNDFMAMLKAAVEVTA